MASTELNLHGRGIWDSWSTKLAGKMCMCSRVGLAHLACVLKRYLKDLIWMKLVLSMATTARNKSGVQSEK